MDLTDTPGDRVVRGFGSSCGSGVAAIWCGSALISTTLLVPPALLVDRGLFATSLSLATLSRPTRGFPPVLLDGGLVTIFHFGCIGSISRRGKGNSLRGQPACAGPAVTLTERRLSLPMERWPSGRRRSPAKRVGGVKPPRGFKSLPLRGNRMKFGSMSFARRNSRTMLWCGAGDEIRFFEFCLAKLSHRVVVRCG